MGRILRVAVSLLLLVATAAGCGGSRRGATPAATPAPQKLTVTVEIRCTSGLYCANQGNGVCRFDQTYRRFPSSSVTVAGADRVVLASRSLPIDGQVVGTGGVGGFLCTAVVSVEVPRRDLYLVDAFGLASATGATPFTVQIP